MSTAQELETRIRRLSWKGLSDLWRNIKANDTPAWSSGKALEYLVLRAFEIDETEQTVVRYPYEVSLFGGTVEEIDGAVHLSGLSCLVECKNRSQALAIGPIAKLRNQLLRRPAGTVGLMFSSSGFTEATTLLAHFTLPQAILLWSGSDVDWSFSKRSFCRGLRQKLQGCVERGIPDYNLMTEGIR